MKKLTPTEKLERKKINKEKTQSTETTKIITAVICTIIGLLLLNNVIMYFSESYSYFYLNYISNFTQGLLFKILGYLPYENFIYTISILISVIVLFILDIYYESFCKKEIPYINKKVNNIKVALMIIIFIEAIAFIPNMYYIHLPNFDKLYYKEYSNKTYKKDDLIYLNNYLKDKVLTYADTLERDNQNKIVFKGDYNKAAIKALKNSSKEIPLLKGLYPGRSYDLTDFMKGLVGSDVIGLTVNHSTYFDYDSSVTTLLNTIIHEYCHTKGIVRENETVYCSFIAGLNSNNKVVEYSSYIEAFIRASYALSEIDQDEEIAISDEVYSRCLTKNQNEFCDLSIKNIGGYINGAYSLKIVTYSLKNYKNYKEELNKSLKVLYDNKAIVKINKKDASLEEINSLIDNDSVDRVYIEMPLNKKKYKKIESALKNSKLYKTIYQQNQEYEESEEKKDIEKYYLAPYPNKDSLLLGSDITSIDFTYERVTRLLLEYYDKHGYK